VQLNQLKTLWAANQTVLNIWLTIPSAWTAEIVAHTGADAVTLDLQHGLIDYGTAVSMLQAMSPTATIPLARLPWNDPSIIMRLLDAGVHGLICPMINTRADCEAFVGACRYPPQGYRSFGPARAVLYAGDDYGKQANQTIVALAMIETAEALENVDAIASTPGLDGLYVGPWDLSLSLGLERLGDFEDPVLARALDRVLQAAAQYRVVPGIHAATPAAGVALAARGYRFVTVADDTGLLQTGAARALAETRTSLKSGR
jgi:4-hydroxy-2-oxoheptanedioate aldolase